jgi:hypothetical protein
MGDAMMLGRGRSREGVAENDCDGNCKFCLAQHSLSPWSSFAAEARAYAHAAQREFGFKKEPRN